MQCRKGRVYLITSSATTSSVGGTLRPSALALMLIAGNVGLHVKRSKIVPSKSGGEGQRQRCERESQRQDPNVMLRRPFQGCALHDSISSRFDPAASGLGQPARRCLRGYADHEGDAGHQHAAEHGVLAGGVEVGSPALMTDSAALVDLDQKSQAPDAL
jgi:hypothetical protein